ncbi:hypothetical protein [Rhizobium phage RHph_X2_25]|nr:hypothetical protein [Rhizobium phage RHph_X2_25]
MSKRHTTRQPAALPAANNNTPLLTIERAIADGLCPTSLRQVAAANERKGDRRQRVADNLHRIADRMELLGYGREREAA